MADKIITPSREKWKGVMTDRERFNNQMHYKPIDRCFNMEFGYWDENFIEWEEFAANGVKTNEDADVFFNFDRFHVLSGNIWLDPPFAEQVVEETETTKILINSDGLFAEVPKDGHSTIPHYTKSSVVTPEDWARVKEERLNRDNPARKLSAEQLDELKQKYAGRDYPLGVNTGSMIGKIRDMLTFEGLAYAVYDYPEMVEDMVETSCVLVEDYLKQVLPVIDFDFAAGWEDICFKTGPIVSINFFRDVVTPRYKRIGKLLQGHNVKLWYTDCDGDVRHILPYLIEGGINCLFPFEVNGCAHPAELLNEYGKDLRIMGGVDKLKLIEGKEAIKEYLESLVPLVERGGYIPFCDHRCPPDVKYENYMYYLELKEKMFGMK